jgi:hypothetical protein
MSTGRETPRARGCAVGLCATLLLLLFQAGLAGAEDAPSFSIKRDDPPTGSNIRRDRLTSSLPYDKSYAELTDAQRLQFRSRYEVLADADEPPFPQLGLGQIYDPISRAQQKLLNVGMLSLVAYIDETGNATRIEVMSSPSPEMSRFAAMVAMQTKFKPAQCSGAPCPMGFPIRTNLSVDR